MCDLYKPKPGDKLRPSEARVFNEIINTGERIKVISNRLGLTEKGMKFHVSNIFIKCGVKSQLELVVAHYKGRLKDIAA